MQLTFSLEQGRRRGLFSSLRGSTTCTGLGNNVYSSTHDREWCHMKWEGREMKRRQSEEIGPCSIKVACSTITVGYVDRCMDVSMDMEQSWGSWE